MTVIRSGSARILHFLAIAVLTCGCADWPLTSKWAMDDPHYREKYSQPYGDDKPLRMLKQAVDARHISGKGGSYIGLAAADDPFSLGGELGGVQYVNSSVEARGALSGVAGTGAQDWFVGGNFGLRVQTPSRIAPFAGVGTFLGFNWDEVDADNDGIDNDDNGIIDELGEKKTDRGGLAAVYPEFGIHYWLGSDTRMTVSASHWFTTEGRSSDFWFIGVGLALFDLGSRDETDHAYEPLLPGSLPGNEPDERLRNATWHSTINDVLGEGVIVREDADRLPDVPPAVAKQEPEFVADVLQDAPPVGAASGDEDAPILPARFAELPE